MFGSGTTRFDIGIRLASFSSCGYCILRLQRFFELLGGPLLVAQQQYVYKKNKTPSCPGVKSDFYGLTALPTVQRFGK